MKKLLSVLLTICIIFSAFGAVGVFAASGGAASGSSSSSGGSGTGTNTQIPISVTMGLDGANAVNNNGKFNSGDMELNGTVDLGTEQQAQVFVVIAFYDRNGTMADFAMSTKTITAGDNTFYTALDDVNTSGTIKCMVINADNLRPICATQEYAALSDSIVLDLDTLDYSHETSLEHSENFELRYYANDVTSKSTSIGISSEVEVYVNGTEVNNGDLLYYRQQNGTIEFEETTDDRYVDVINITIYEYGIVEEVLADKQCINFIDGTRVVFEFDNPEITTELYDADGSEITLSDIHAGDTVAMIVGDLDGYSGLPVAAKVYTEKITLYNLGDTSFEGMVVGLDTDSIKLYIDGKAYKSAYYYATDNSWSIFLEEAPLGRTGKFYTDIFGKLIGAELYRDCTYGFIIQTSLDTTGFEDNYEAKILTENDGIVTYIIDYDCYINGEFCDVESQADYLNFAQYDTAVDDAESRMIQYYMNKNGEIDDIEFLDNVYSVREVDGEYLDATDRLSGYHISDEMMVYNVGCESVDDVCVTDRSNLVDESSYTGYLIRDDYDDYYNIFILTSGLIAAGDSEQEEENQSQIGFIYAAKLNSSFEEYYQIKMLTQNDGVVLYNVAERCVIDDNRYDVSEQGEYLNIATYGQSDNDAGSRVVEYQLDSDGNINSIKFVQNYDTFDGFNGKYSGGSIDGCDISYKAVIFDITDGDIQTCATIDSSELLDGSHYGGIAAGIDINGKYNIVVLQSCDLSFAPDDSVNIVQSTEPSEYDGYDALKVTYYTNGENTLHEAYFTDDSGCLSYEYEYADLTMGSVFEAIVNKNGFVEQYAVFAVMNPETKEFEYSGLAETVSMAYGEYFANEPGDGVEFIYGYIKDINGSELIVGNRAVDIWSEVAQYTYNTNNAEHKISVGLFDATGVDIHDGEEANLVLIKIFDGDVTDIISVSDRKAVTTAEVETLLYSTAE